MASQVEICNRALIRLAAPTIASIDDGTKSAKLCKKLYDVVVEETHGEGPWSNAVKRVTLSKLTTSPAFGWDFEFQLPNDLIKVITVNDTTPGDFPFAIEGDLLLTNQGSIKIQYVSLLATPGSFGTFLTNSIIDLLTAELSYAFTGNATLTTNYRGNYIDRLSSNLAKDNQQGTKDVIQVRDYIDVR